MNRRNEKNKTVPLFLNIIIFFLGFGLLFVTAAAGSFEMGIHSIYEPVFKLYSTTKGVFPGFELLSILFLLIMLAYYRVSFKVQEVHIKRFILTTIIFVIIAILNPYNYLREGIFPFLMFKLTASTIFAAFLSYFLLSVKNNDFEMLIKNIFKIMLALGLGKAGFDILTYFIGIGPKNAFLREVTTVGGDILVWFSILHILLVAIFFYTRQKKYIYYALLFLICLVFSYQRTALLITIIFDIVFYFIYSTLFTKRLGFFVRNALIGAIIILTAFLSLALTDLGQDLYYRYGSALAFTGLVDIPGNLESPEYTDSGHLQQSITTTNFFIENRDLFWGGGINRRNENYLYVEGQSYGGVHNNIVAMWQYFGMPGVFYYLFLFTFFVYFFFRSLNDRKQLTIYRFIIMAVSLYFIIRAIAGWFSGDFIFLTFQNVFQFILLVSITKLYNYTSNDQYSFESPKAKKRK